MSQTVEQQADICTSTNHQMMKFTHRWQIDNFNFYYKANEDDHPFIISPQLSAPNDSTVQFHFQLYPKGLSEESKDHISIYFHLLSCVKPEVRVQCKMSIIDQKNIKQNTLVFIKKFKPKGSGWGWSKYATHDKLEGLLKNDKLILFSEVEIMIDSINTTTCSKVNPRIESQFLNNFSELFESRKLSDVVLVAGDSKAEHRAHRAILAARSLVFASMFEHDTKDRNEGRVLIEDIDGDVISEMLRFVYTGKVLKLDQLADRLLIAADKYQLDTLKDICEQYIVKNLKSETVLAMLLIADRHSAPLLRSKLIEYINANLPSLTETVNWQAVKDKPELYFELFSKVISQNH